MHGGGGPALYPGEALPWLVGGAHWGASLGSWSLGSPHLLPQRTWTLLLPQVEVNDPPASVFAQLGPGLQAWCPEKHLGPWLQVPKCNEKEGQPLGIQELLLCWALVSVLLWWPP